MLVLKTHWVTWQWSTCYFYFFLHFNLSHLAPAWWYQQCFWIDHWLLRWFFNYSIFQSSLHGCTSSVNYNQLSVIRLCLVMKCQRQTMYLWVNPYTQMELKHTHKGNTMWDLLVSCVSIEFLTFCIHRNMFPKYLSFGK